MQTVKHKHALPIWNMDEICGEGLNHVHNHSSLFPNSIRGLICGPSSCGKSNIMLSMLLDVNGLKFENVYTFSKSLHQPKYVMLEKILKSLPEIGYYPYSNNAEIPSPSEAKPNSIFIFDDVACDKQDKIREFFSMGRHSKVDSFYLSQTYTAIPKILVRDNANFIVLFKQDTLNLTHVYKNHVGGDMTFEKFKELCAACWNNKYGFMTICKEFDLNRGRYRRQLDEFIKLEQ